MNTFNPVSPVSGVEKNPNEGYYLDDYEFEFIDKDEHCNTLVINPLKGAQIVSFYIDCHNHLHAVVKEQPYLQYNPIPITVKMQHAPVCNMNYQIKVNPDFYIDNVVICGKNGAGYPEFYIYKDMNCKYWQDENSMKRAKNILGSIF